MTVVPPDDELFDTLYDEDPLFIDDKQVGCRVPPPPAWRVSQRAVDELVDFARLQLDLAWLEVREHRRRARFEAAILDPRER